MNLLLVIAVVLTITQAKPSPKADVGLGYNYKPPATSYGVPTGIVNQESQDVKSASTTAAPQVSDVSSSYVSSTPASIPNIPSISYATSTASPISFSTTPATNFQIPIRDFTTFTGGIQSIANIPLQAGAYPSSFLGNSIGANVNIPSAVPNIYSNIDNFNLQGIGGNFASGVPSFGAGQFDIQNKYNIQAPNNEYVSPEGDAQVEVSRHLYFYSSPEDIQAPQQRINFPKAPAKQNVKVLFIKAPALVTPAPISIPAPKQNEEKTVVYVLVKKPEEPAPIEVNTPPPTPPSKPEVYFIKYKTQQEAEEAISKIQKSQQPNSGGTIQSLNSIQPNFAVQNIQNQGFPNLGTSFQTQGVSVTNNGALGLGPQLVDSTTTVSPFSFNSFSTAAPSIGGGLQGSFQVGPVAGLSQSQYSSSGSISNNVNSGNSVPINYPVQGNEIQILSGNGASSNPSSVDVSSQSESINSNEKALSDSFGGQSESEASNTIPVSTIKPQSVYGVPNKRGIRKFFNV